MLPALLLWQAQAAAQPSLASADPYSALIGHGVLGSLVVIMLAWNYRLTEQLRAAQSARVDDGKQFAVQLKAVQDARVDDAKVVLASSLQLADKVSTAVHQTAETADLFVRTQQQQQPRGGPG